MNIENTDLNCYNNASKSAPDLLERCQESKEEGKKDSLLCAYILCEYFLKFMLELKFVLEISAEW